jgi:hypothetical protein
MKAAGEVNAITVLLLHCCRLVTPKMAWNIAAEEQLARLQSTITYPN